jgi:replicative DNA helicase
MGKTAKLLNIIYRISKRGIACSLNTMEMSKKQIIDRLLALDSAVSSTLQKRAKELDKADVRKIIASYGRLADLKIFIDDAPQPSPREIMSKSEWLVRQHDVKFIGIDGIYLMRSDYNFNGDKVAEVGQISRGCKLIASTLDVTVGATHQLNRKLEERVDKRPILSDLRSSGEVEQDADSVIFLYRDWVYDNSSDPHLTEIIVAKNRDGQTGTVKEHFENTLAQFSDTIVEKYTFGGGR